LYATGNPPRPESGREIPPTKRLIYPLTLEGQARVNRSDTVGDFAARGGATFEIICIPKQVGSCQSLLLPFGVVLLRKVLSGSLPGSHSGFVEKVGSGLHRFFQQSSVNLRDRRMHFRPAAPGAESCWPAAPCWLEQRWFWANLRLPASAATSDSMHPVLTSSRVFLCRPPMGPWTRHEAGGGRISLLITRPSLRRDREFRLLLQSLCGRPSRVPNHPNGANDGAQTAQAGIIFRYPTEGMASLFTAGGQVFASEGQTFPVRANSRQTL